MTNLLTLARKLLEKEPAVRWLKDDDPVKVLERRVIQVGRLQRRMRRACAALEDALIRVHDRTSA